MAKASAAIHTPRPSALRSSLSSCSAPRSSVGSTSSSTAAAAAAASRDSASNAKVAAKCLIYDDDDYFTLPSAAAAPAPVPADGLATQEDDLAPLLELPDPDVVSGDTSSTSVVSAAADDALTASADSCVTEVPARADSAIDTEPAAAALPEEMNLALAELRDAGGLSPRSKRLLSALAEAAALELAAPSWRRSRPWPWPTSPSPCTSTRAAPTSGTATLCCPPPDRDGGIAVALLFVVATCK
ncbi:hypothetical protein SORBI_3004G352400 [Sorghum bicolor]|uniref:Uncharacterized protein n=1 Tax=Sorghum bicolor TaxID=4558 RepID=A0A1Z5RRH8_SORBI|nr:hypothetical protein SORBI_3004G352400 [Sorghum bicolor]